MERNMIRRTAFSASWRFNLLSIIDYFCTMRTIRIILAVISFILFLLILIFMDFDDLSWSANRSNYLGLFACILNIWALLFIIKDKD